MKLSLFFRGTLAAFALILPAVATPAQADTYTIVNLSDANSHNIVGITDANQVVIFNSFCGEPNQSCYTTYTNGVETGESTTAPALTYDDGAACSPSVSGFHVDDAVCNNGRIAINSGSNPNGEADGGYTGTPSDLSFLSKEQLLNPVLNASGDLAWVDGRDEFIFEAIDTTVAAPPTVPEPSTFLLLGTGMTSIASLLRRRMAKQ